MSCFAYRLNKSRRVISKRLLPVMLMFFIPIGVFAKSISLHAAERIALKRSPEIQALQAKQNALSEEAIATHQLADPKLWVGAMNFPVDSFDFSQEPMTQLQVGLQQQFPKGRSLHYRSLQKQDFSRAESEKNAVMKLQILRAVRMNWLQLYYWLQVKRIVIKQRGVFQHLVKVTESMLANNKAQQKDVLQAQLELTTLKNRIININRKIRIARAGLSRWSGWWLANKANPTRLPHWPRLITKKHSIQLIQRHPSLLADHALIKASYAGVHWAKQQYIPGLTLGVGYGFRSGRNINGSKRPDFLTATASINLPIFAHNRQSRILHANEDLLIASEDNARSRYRQLMQNLTTQYANWQQYYKSARLYQTRLVSQATQYAKASVVAYQNNKTDFLTVADGEIRAMQSRIMALQMLVAANTARVNLLYLQGK